MLYLTRPVVIHAQPSDIGRDDRFDFFSLNAGTAYGRTAAESSFLSQPLREGLVAIETYGAAAARMALSPHEGTPSILFDCRAIPGSDSPAASYRLAVAAGLKTTPPVLLTGLGGIEALIAMRFHACSVTPGHALLVSSRGIVSGAAARERPFGAACLARRKSFGCEEIHVRSIHLEHSRSGVVEILERVAVTMARREETDRPCWIAAAPWSDEVASWAERRSDSLILLGTDSPAQEASGQPDPLSMLDRHADSVPEREIGLLVCAGATGCLGIAALSVHRGTCV